MNYIIIEDEPLATERVLDFAGKLPFLKVMATFESAIPAIEYLKTNTINLIFLDLNTGELSGIQFLELVKPKCAVIILTAYENFALKGFELNVTDYLLKPFSFERFSEAVDRACRSHKQVEKSFIFIKTQYRLEKVMYSDLIYIEGENDYRRIYTTTKSFKTLQTFGELEKELPASRFCRVHKSFLISLAKIGSIEKDFIHIGEVVIPLSETYKKSFMEKIK